VSDAGRPQFLPPEEPPAAPPPMPPPAPPQRDARGPIIAAAVTVALLVTAGLGVLIYRGGEVQPVAGPSVQPSTSPSSSMPVYTTLPNPCTAPGNTVPPDVRSVTPDPGSESCDWDIERPDRTRTLEVAFKLEKDDQYAGSGTAAAVKDFADDLERAGDPVKSGGFESNPERLGGLGDEAFAARAFDIITAGRTPHTAKDYYLSGAEVEARLRNVVITVTWRGADYPPSVRQKKKVVGKELPYVQSKEQAVTVLKAVLAAFH
jgi:hypothetical protein